MGYMEYVLRERDAEKRGEEKGRAEGRAEGRVEGEERKARDTAINLYSMGLTTDAIAKAVGYTVETVKSWLKVTPTQTAN